jgi:hypothetical protein
VSTRFLFTTDARAEGSKKLMLDEASAAKGSKKPPMLMLDEASAAKGSKKEAAAAKGSRAR